MLLKKPPAHCPFREECLRLKRIEPDERVNPCWMITAQGTPVLNVFGTPITCDVGWIAPKNIKIFRAAIFNLHIANN